jgi:hypothetical protein
VIPGSPLGAEVKILGLQHVLRVRYPAAGPLAWWPDGGRRQTSAASRHSTRMEGRPVHITAALWQSEEANQDGVCALGRCAPALPSSSSHCSMAAWLRISCLA